MTTYPEHVAKVPELDVVEFLSPPNSEAIALRLALIRLEQDNRILQKALFDATTARDHWKDLYMQKIGNMT